MKTYFACAPIPDQQRTLTEEGAKNRLISWSYLNKKRPDLLRDIAETGLTENVERPDESIDENFTQNTMKVRDSSIHYQFAQRKMNRIENQIKDKLRLIKANFMEIGKLLCEAKEILEHGEFKPWIKETFGSELPYSTAYSYMKLYKELKNKDDIIILSLPIWFLMYMYQKDFPNEVKELIYSSRPFITIQYGDLNKVVEAYKAYKKGEVTLDELKALTEAEIEIGKSIMDEKRQATKKERCKTEIQKLMMLFWRIDKNIAQFKKHFINIQKVNPLHNDQMRDMNGRVEEAIKLFQGLNDFLDEKLSEKSND